MDHWILKKRPEIYTGKRQAPSSTNGDDKIGQLHNMDQHRSSCKNHKSKWIKDLNIKPDSLILIKKVRNSLECIGTGDDFMNRTPIAIPQAQQSAINK